MPMPLCAGDILSFLSCLGNTYLHLQQKPLLRKASIASSPQQALSHQVQCSNNSNGSLTPEVSNAVFRLKKQGIQVSPTILHRVKKKEAWKARHRERREKEKADRVPDPLWYDWPEEHGKLEMCKLGIAQTEEEGTDEFLRFLEEARPTRRIAVHGFENTVLYFSKGAGSPSTQKRAISVRRHKTFLKTRSGGSMMTSPIQSIAQVWKASSTSKTENTSPLHHSAFEGCFPWTGKPVFEDDGASHEPKLYINNCNKDSNKLEFTETLNCDEGFGDCKEYMINYRKRSNDGDFAEDLNLEKHNLHVRMDSSNYATSCSAATLRSCNATAQDVINIDGNYLPAREKLHPLKEFNTAVVEKFLDDEIDGEPKGQEVWMKGVGIVKDRKREFSKEIKEMILARRKADWSALYEKDDLGSESDAVSKILFDGQAALLEDRRIQRLAAKLQDVNYWTSKGHFSKLMHSGKMKLTEDRVIRLIQILGEKGNWRRAMQVVQWVHKRQRYQFELSKFVFTSLLSILGKARRPVEALTVFSVMRESFSSYPDMAAYHVMAVTLGQSGKLRELLQLIESLQVGPPQPIKFIPLVNWDPILHPDIVVYNSVLIACISTKEWAGVTWTWEQIKKGGIKANGATFGLTIEAMLKADNFNQAICYYNRMERAGFPPNAQTYKCLVESFGKVKMIDEAMELVQEMEASGIVANASVYFALACSFCIAGRLKDALVQVRKMQDLTSRKPDVITYTGLIQTCHKVGRIQDAIFLFEHMQHVCAPNVRTCNEMIKLYGWNGMFEEARKVYEGIKRGQLESCFLYDGATRLSCDLFTFELMLKAALVSEKWDYFDSVYWEMTWQGYHLSGKTNQWVMLKVARLKKIDIADDILQRLRKFGEIPQLRFYEAHILACLQEKCIQKALIYLNDMRIDGYQVVSTINSLQEHLQRETRDSFIQTINSLEKFSNLY